MSTATAAANVSAQIKSANAQTKAINAQRTVVREETRQKASAELFDSMREGRREQAKIRAASGEAGLSLSSGGSIESLLLDSAMQTELANDRTIANMESRHRANEADADSMLSRIQKPTALGAGLQIASAAASGWAGVENAKIRTRPSNVDLGFTTMDDVNDWLKTLPKRRKAK
ncbi:hypothetical protein IFT55_03770 [Sphingomonas sp. CFBP 13720]|uniref:virion core protein, T7 gp14 family n=1 Tax=Sphingomonas sp. CFBP 13720 TaxID=2775302 RepID=UPI0017848CC6|nr:hypothetical protein [Sphingomonas sp. CFBP 13720]MBD8677557.1 hypothetical protein [Sphingomonas sp. CFBP 13720]